MASRKSKEVGQFGDFQTPDELAIGVTQLLRRLEITPDYILEPTCGSGAFLSAAATIFPETEGLLGFDINAQHLAAAKKRLTLLPNAEQIVLQEGDFFKIDWSEVLRTSEGKWLILGNPPWVTNTDLSKLNSQNLPDKSNFQGHNGIGAMTGKSNFDISEWMLLRYLDWLRGRAGALAVLCKTSVAHKILAQTWKEKYPISSVRLFSVDAMKYFSASVDACLLVLETSPGATLNYCDVYEDINSPKPSHQIGFHDGLLITDIERYKIHQHLYGLERDYRWRSGIKHDCAKVMELRETGEGFLNGLGELVELEDTFLFPLLKSSDIANSFSRSRLLMIVPQRTIGEDTITVATRAPRTWKYLQAHAHLLNRRGSSIYRNRPAFSIFGVGEYSFAPWKVAISGFYKRLNFVKIGPINERSAVFDDTVYFLACYSEDEADFLCALLSSKPAHEFYESMVFWADKRPITIDLLKRLCLKTLADELKQTEIYAGFVANRKKNTTHDQLALPLL